MTDVDDIKAFLNWKEISKNKDISEEFIINNIDCPWDFDLLSANPIVTADLVESFPDKPWNWVILYLLKNVRIEFVKKYMSSYRIFVKSWNWMINKVDTYDSDITNAATFINAFSKVFDEQVFKINKFENLMKINLIKKYEWESVLFSREFIIKHIDKCDKWDFTHLSSNQYITTDLVERFPDKPWNWVILYINNKVPLELVKTRITSLDTYIKDAKERKIKISNIKLEFLECFKDYDWSPFMNLSSFPLNWKYMITSYSVEKIVDLINSFPDNIWDWDYICNNVYDYKSAASIIKSFPDKPWNWEHIFQNIKYYKYDIDWFHDDVSRTDLIKYFPDKPWNWEYICNNFDRMRNATDLIKSFPDKPWDWEHICEITRITRFTMHLVMSFRDKPWNWERICLHIEHNDWSQDDVSRIDFIKSFPDLPWNWEYMCNSLQSDLIKSFPDKPWNWERICEIDGIYRYTMYLIKSFPDKPWNWDNSINLVSKKFDFDCVKIFPHKPYNWQILSTRKDIATLENILSYPDLPWDWKQLSKPNYFNYEILENLPNKDWDWKELSKSQKVPINFVTSNKNKEWDWEKISKNTDMLKNKSIRIDAKDKIVNQFRVSMSNPEYRLCRKRLLYEFKDLCGF